MMIKTVVELDLIGDSDKALELEEQLGADLVMQFNDQIQQFVNAGLTAAGVTRDETVFALTGDGAILLFDEPAAAHRFAQAVHEACDRHNRGKSTASAKRWFRIGAATGHVTQRMNNDKRELAGITLSNAVRLESSGAAGHLVVDLVTFGGLPTELQEAYGDEEEIAGKRDERIKARRCKMVDAEEVLPSIEPAAEPFKTGETGDIARTYEVGATIDAQYHVDQYIKGGMSSVYVVTDNVTQKRYVLKSVDGAADRPDAENLAARFEREAAVWVNLDHHPHIVQAFTFLRRTEQPMLLLEYVDGPSLASVLKQHPRLSPRQVVRWGRQFCSGMHYVHRKELPGGQHGILHRDIKPGNILFTRRNELKITDFGLAKLDDGRVKSISGQFVGTVGYSSPEQLRDAKHIDRRAEIFSFGVVFYEMLAGAHAFPFTSLADAMQSIQFRQPDWEPIPAVLRPIVQYCLQKSPQNRYTSFAELDRALEEVEHRLPVNAGEQVCRSCGFIGAQPPTCIICQTSIMPSGPTPASTTDYPPAATPAADPFGSTTVLRCKCGAVLERGADSCRHCGSQHAQMQCGACGTWNSSTNSFCNSCGGNLRRVAEA